MFYTRKKLFHRYNFLHHFSCIHFVLNTASMRAFVSNFLLSSHSKYNTMYPRSDFIVAYLIAFEKALPTIV